MKDTLIKILFLLIAIAGFVVINIFVSNYIELHFGPIPVIAMKPLWIATYLCVIIYGIIKIIVTHGKNNE